MALSVAADARPAFFSKNWINEDAKTYGTFTASEMQALFKRILDGDPLSVWSDSSATDGTSVVLTVQLMEKGLNTSRTIDLILFQNINWKNFLVEYSTDGGANWLTVTGGDYQSGVANFAATDFAIAPAASLTANALRVTITHTQTANESKKLGGWIAAELKTQLSYGFDAWSPKPRANINEVILGNGRASREYILRSANTHIYWGADYGFSNIPQSEIDALMLIQEAGAPFVVYMEPGERKRQAYECFFRTPWLPHYTTDQKSAGYSATIPLMEAVGA